MCNGCCNASYTNKGNNPSCDSLPSFSLPRNKKILLFFFPFLALVILLMPVRNMLTPHDLISKIHTYDRVRIWYCFAEMIKDHPITGIGFGMQTYYDENLLNKYNERVPAKYKQATPVKAPHNIIVDIAVRVGLVGLTLFFYIIFAFVKMSWHIIRSGKDDFIRHWGVCFLAAFVAVFIQGQFENTLWGPPVIILYTILALMTILWHMNTKEDVI
jgi:O-antigen ligase